MRWCYNTGSFESVASLHNTPAIMKKRDKAIIDNWREEMRAAQTYETLGKVEKDPHRKALFQELAEMEKKHAGMWAQRMAQLGIRQPPPPPGRRAKVYRLMAKHLGPVRMLERIEKDERHHAHEFQRQLKEIHEDDAVILREIAHDEKDLTRRLHHAVSESREQGELNYLLHREKWHVKGGSWVADAIYGVNDGLGAVFGIVSGMAGYTGGSGLVLVAGLAGMLASALSMGSSAYLAAKSEKEVIESELAREREEILEEPEEERRELELIYKLKGFSDEEVDILVDRLSKNPEDMLSTLAHEELGISHSSAPNPWTSMFSSMISTAIGASVPLIPFFFTTGMPAVVAALVISLMAHFAVGALKSLLTTRHWFTSGLEMTSVGVIVSVATYILGRLLGQAGLPGAG